MDPSALAVKFQVLDATLEPLAANLAVDEALLVDAEENGGPLVLRFWEAEAVAVILGASCRLAENVQVDACRADGVTILRRSSGGGTVVIGPGCLNVAVVLPVDAASELKAVDTAQVWAMGRMAAGLRRAGGAVEVRGSGDLVVGERKVSGSAQRRLRRHLMIHASLLYDFPLELIDRYTRMPPKRPAYRGDRPHAEFVTNLPMPRESLVAAITAAWVPGGVGAAPLARVPEALVADLLEKKFADRGWIERL